ncbi:MAG: hypothetical protein Tsb0033_02500 [Winogradskyella sp.]
MKKVNLLIGALLCVSFSYTQNPVDKEDKTNPIVFIETIFGYAGGNAHGPTLGAEINYQLQKNLFSLRYIYQTRFNFDFAILGLVGLPIITNDLNINELSALYGYRNVTDGHSWSFSGGLSTNFVSYKTRTDVMITRDFEVYMGFPFEINIKWFKKEKKRFRAYYGLIPIGKPTSFGRSVGFKFYGNIGKMSYVGLGLNYGFGWHKRY